MFLDGNKLKLKARNAEIYDRGVWYLDTGAISHMAGVKNKFSDLDETVKGKLKFGDGSAMVILGRGTILFQCRNGEQRALSNLYYVPPQKSNIISIGHLCERAARWLLRMIISSNMIMRGNY